MTTKFKFNSPTVSPFATRQQARLVQAKLNAAGIVATGASIKRSTGWNVDIKPTASVWVHSRRMVCYGVVNGVVQGGV